MDFWKFCEKVELGIGKNTVIRNLERIHEMYMKNQTVGQVIEEFKESEQPVFSSMKSLIQNYANSFILIPRQIVVDIITKYHGWTTGNQTPQQCIARLKSVVEECQKTIRHLERMPPTELKVTFPLHEVVDWKVENTLKDTLIENAKQRLGIYDNTHLFTITYEGPDIIVSTNTY